MKMTLPENWDWKNPDYDTIWRTRAQRLDYLRRQPEILLRLKEYYSSNPADFINDWGVTVDPRLAERGLNPVVPFLLFPKQAEFIDWLRARWLARENGLVEKSRDMGVSWLGVAFAAWMILFVPGAVVGMGSRKEEYVDKIGDPKSLFWKTREFINMLPGEFQPKHWDASRMAPHMRVTNPDMRAFITGEAGDNIGRGNRTSVYWLDESAFLERPDQVDAALSQTTNCRIDVSTPNGAGNPFYKKAHDGVTKKFVFDWRAQPLDAKVMTPSGWVRMGDVTPGSKVTTSDGGSATVVAVHPHGEKPVYHVRFNDGSSTECCADHLWEVTPKGNQRAERRHITRVMTLGEILKDYCGKDSRGYNVFSYQIPLTSPVKFNSRAKLPIDPYVLGCLLGDGSLPTKSSAAVQMVIGVADSELVALIDEKLPQGCKLKRCGDIQYWVSAGRNFLGGSKGRGAHNPVNAAIVSLGLAGTTSYNKFIPEKYKYASISDRLSLLQGLMDTDGGVRKSDPGVAGFTTASQQLRDDVIHLAQSLGGTASWRVAHKAGSIAVFGDRQHARKMDVYMVHVKLPSDFTPFRLPRKVDAFTPATKYPPRRSIVSITPAGVKPVQCIEIDSSAHLYLTDDFIVTHNCDPRKDDAWYEEQKRKLDPVVLAQEVDRDYTASVQNAFIPGTLVKMAITKGPMDMIAQGPLMVGVDVARFGNDKTVVTFRRGRVALSQHVYGMLDVEDCAGTVKTLVRQHMERPAQIAVDTIGIGAGVADILRREFGDVVADVNSAIRLSDGEHYNLRARMWRDMREWLKSGASIPNDGELISDLTALQYLYRGGALLIEAKDDAKKRGIKSPDRADSLALTFAIPPKLDNDEFSMPQGDHPLWQALDEVIGY